MARIRTLKPEFWQDEKLAPLPPIDRLVFLGLISQADDAGRLVDNIRLLDGLIFPETQDTCGPSLETLTRLSRITRYVSSSGQRLIQVNNWERHQSVAHPSPYTLPGPDSEGAEVQRVSESSCESPENLVRSSGDSHASTYTLRPTPNEQRTTSNGSSNGATSPGPDGFDFFWESYPKRAGTAGKKEAFKAWRARRRERYDAAVLTEAAVRYARWCFATKKTGTEKVMRASTFLNDPSNFTNEWTPPSSSGNGTGSDVQAEAQRILDEVHARFGTVGT